MITELRKKMVDVVLECLVKKATFITTPIGNKYKTKFIWRFNSEEDAEEFLEDLHSLLYLPEEYTAVYFEVVGNKVIALIETYINTDVEKIFATLLVGV